MSKLQTFLQPSIDPMNANTIGFLGGLLPLVITFPIHKDPVQVIILVLLGFLSARIGDEIHTVHHKRYMRKLEGELMEVTARKVFHEELLKLLAPDKYKEVKEKQQLQDDVRKLFGKK